MNRTNSLGTEGKPIPHSWLEAPRDAPVAAIRQLSRRARRALRRVGVARVDEVPDLALVELESLPNVGAVTIREPL